MTATLSDLESRLAALEHINEIKELKARYWSSVDRQRLDAVRACFVEHGAIIDMEGIPPCSDREDFIKVMTAQGGKPGFHSMHSGQNPIITLTGPDTATGVWDAFFVGIDMAQRLTIQLSGEYNDVYVRAGGRWLIQVQKFRQTSLLIQNIAEDGSPTVVSFGLPDPGVFASAPE
jgi:hypothetical protein